MREKKYTFGIGRSYRSLGIFRRIPAVSILVCTVFILSCTQLEKPEPEPFFAETAPPKAQEFRWSNGKLPKSFDPALASAPPETDIVRALYEGLTETDPATLEEVAGVAENWSSSDDFKVWIFKLRKNAKWSNGKPVTANDFVLAWKRLIQLGDKTAHRNLLSNIAGVPRSEQEVPASNDAIEPFLRQNSNTGLPGRQTQYLGRVQTNTNTKPAAGQNPSNTSVSGPTKPTGSAEALGIVADDPHTLKVTLRTPDRDFPKLVANPVFRPIFSNGEEFIGKDLNPSIVTNGPFRATKIEASGLVLEPAEHYWNRENIKLERVHIVSMDSPEKALSAYQAGDLDAVTNADFSPLALKLLTPYEDFRKTTHSALNFYEINSTKPPFADRRVREALSNAIERERLTEGEMEGLTRPALSFLPYSTTTKARLTQDKEKAKDLLEDAGFPGGTGFPVIKLLVNRNDTQQRVAKSVARMWKQNLNLETEIVVKDTADLERMRKAGEFDLVRRGVVFPTSDETANFMAVFEIDPTAAGQSPSGTGFDGKQTSGPTAGDTLPVGGEEAIPSNRNKKNSGESIASVTLTEDEALYDLRAIPLYFPISFALVKPYVSGFEMNSLDAVNLANVSINSEWQPKSR